MIFCFFKTFFATILLLRLITDSHAHSFEEFTWFSQRGEWKKNYEEAQYLLYHAQENGLNPNDYQVHFKGKTIAQIDLEFSKSFEKFVQDLLLGKPSLQKTHHIIKFPPKSLKIQEIISRFQTSPSSQFILDLTPKHPQYLKLKEKLKSLLSTSTGNEPSVYLPTSLLLKPGDRHEAVKLLRTRLKTPTPQGQIGDLYDNNLKDAVIEFQKQNGLDSDGVIGSLTLGRLNQSAQSLIKKILINMERWRWLEELPKDYILVNIPGYWVQAVSPENSIIIPAIVGQPGRSTPQFIAPLSSITINPSWGVPMSIATKDKLRKIQNDPEYLIRSGYTVTDSSGEIVHPLDVDWDKYDSSYFPYHLRQKPGRMNALGQIKFNVNNNFSIYLHGTPEMKLFEKKNRALSSGCIRLENPILLANWLLPKHSPEEFTRMINKKNSVTLTLEKPVFVYFVYFTVWVNKNDELVVHDDPYQLDSQMEKLMFAPANK